MKKAGTSGFIKVSALTGRNLKEILRDPLSLIFALAFPEAMLIIFYFAFRGLTNQFEMKYLCPSIVVFAQAFLALFTGLLISLDRESAFLTRLYVSGTRSCEFIAGYTAAVFPIAAVQSALIFLTGMIIDQGFASVFVFAGIAVSLLNAMLFIGFGVLFGTVFSVKTVGGVSSILITGQSVLSGMWFPPEGLSKGFISFMNILPFKNAATLTVGVTDGFNFTDGFLTPFSVVSAYAIVVFIVSVIVFNRKMKTN